MSWLLFSSSRSPFVRKVRIAAHELGLAERITLVPVVTTPMAPAPDVVPHNPLGMIPTLVAEDEVIIDSFEIIAFFDHQAGGQLFSQTDRRDCGQRHAVANGAMDKALRLLDETFRVQNQDTTTHIDGYAGAIRRAIDWMEPRLKDERFDVGDITYAALLSYLDLRFPQYQWTKDTARTRAFLQEANARPSMIATRFEGLPAG